MKIYFHFVLQVFFIKLYFLFDRDQLFLCYWWTTSNRYLQVKFLWKINKFKLPCRFNDNCAVGRELGIVAFGPYDSHTKFDFVTMGKIRRYVFKHMYARTHKHRVTRLMHGCTAKADFYSCNSFVEGETGLPYWLPIQEKVRLFYCTIKWVMV